MGTEKALPKVLEKESNSRRMEKVIALGMLGKHSVNSKEEGMVVNIGAVL